MNWEGIADASSELLSLILIVRLLSLRLGGVYRVFGAFLAFRLFFTIVAYSLAYIHNPRLDYRVIWICMSAIGWVVSLWLVYSLLRAILAELPGIFTFSSRLLKITFVSVVALGALTIRLDIALSGTSEFASGPTDAVGGLVRMAFDLERVISTVALLVLLVMLSFVLWFPVRMPKNLVIFSTGFLIYFAADTALFLTRGVWSRETLVIISYVRSFIFCACYVYWAVFITAAGEKTTVRVGHRWHGGEHERLIGQLETMNASLLRAARRS